MKFLQNLHTHCTYCDGRNTPEEMIRGAIERGFDSIGFSSHCPMPTSRASMLPERLEDYRREIAQLKEKYAGQIDIFAGLEVERLSPADVSGFDYLIGSLHYMRFGDQLVPFDRAAPVVRELIDTYFDGDGMKYAKAYYEALASLPEYGDFDIIGHLDILTKHAEKEDFFPAASEEYREYALRAVQSLKGKIPFFEVNTGAVARGYRTRPYPAPFILHELRRQGFQPVITSDCHDVTKIDCAFEQAEKLLIDCGFTHRYVLTKQGFVPILLGQEEK